MKQTAVDWLYDKLEHTRFPTVEELNEILQTAREMHRNEIEEAFVAGDERGTGEIPFNCEQYYTQTFEQHG